MALSADQLAFLPTGVFIRWRYRYNPARSGA